MSVEVVPNGVYADRFFEAAKAEAPRKARSAVLVGSIEDWVDLDLLVATAQCLRDWTGAICMARFVFICLKVYQRTCVFVGQ